MRVPFDIDSNAGTVRVMMNIPDSVPFNNKVIIACYGFNGNRVEEHRMMIKLGDILQSKGFIMVRLDYNGQGISDGNMYDVSFEQRVNDVLETINYIRGCFNGSNDLKFYLIGFSDGARIATKVCLKKNIDGLILWNPIFFMERQTGSGNKSREKSSDGMMINSVTGQRNYLMYGVPVDLKYLNSMLKTSDLESYLSLDNKCKKICIWGSSDKYTANVRENLILREDIENYLLDGAGHLFNGRKYETEVIEITTKFLLEA